MARRTPNCAYCGEPLNDSDCFRWMSPTLPGKPEVGWHCFDSGKCDVVDSLRANFPAKHRKTLIQQLREIEARGPGRLVANKGWLRVLRTE